VATRAILLPVFGFLIFNVSIESFSTDSIRTQDIIVNWYNTNIRFYRIEDETNMHDVYMVNEGGMDIVVFAPLLSFQPSSHARLPL